MATMRIGWLLFLVSFAVSVQAANRLAQSDSPYLRMHGENPVDWYPWGEEAFEKAKREDKPVFLSIGYSACYWCRVAEETLYRDPAIAAQMNASFINVKVDREQRPDLDRLYMNATYLLSGHGGWPNNLFLTPERKPFFAGSYFPPKDDEFGRPGFPSVMKRITEAWQNRRSDIEARAEQVAQALQRQAEKPAVLPAPTVLRDQARQSLLQRADAERGGLKTGGAAKFPMVPELTLLLGDPQGAVVVRQALDAMALSALRDHLGGGFHRYTIDPGWNQPHFEKMLYDNAQLLRLFATAGHHELHHMAARETADFLLREMQDHAGGFYASLDAVSNGREGAFYLWREEEIRTVLGQRAKRFLSVYRVHDMPGHFADPAAALEGTGGALRLQATRIDNARTLSREIAALAPERAALLKQRATRPRPARDEKLIVAWNGLAIEALAIAGQRFNEPAMMRAAQRAAERLWAQAWDAHTARLHHALFEDRAQGEGFLEDYALFGNGLLTLAETTHDLRWRQRAVEIAAALLRHFGRADGTLAATRHEAELFASADEIGDGPYPAGNSAAYRLLTRLAALGEPSFRQPAERLLAALLPQIARQPERWPALLAALPESSGERLIDPAAGSAGVVTARAHWRGDRLVVAVQIAPGWHVNANPASLDSLIPTRLDFAGATPLAVHYPPSRRFRAAFARSELAVYAGTMEIGADFPSGQRPTRAALTVQACSDEVCLPPATLEIALP